LSTTIASSITNRTATPIPPRLRIDSESLEKNTDDYNSSSISKNESISCNGKIILLNTAESFKRLDKQSSLDKLGERIAALCKNCSVDGDNQDISALTSFQCVSFLDLKKHSAVYWFAFPAIAPRKPIRFSSMSGPLRLREVFDDSQCKRLSVAVTYMRIREPNYRCPPYFIAINLLKDGLPFDAKSSKLPIRCTPLSYSNYMSLSEEEKANAAFCFVDPCSLPENPGWPMRNLVAYLGMKLGLKVAHIVAFRPSALRRISTDLIESFCERCQTNQNTDDDFVNVEYAEQDACSGANHDRSLLLSVSLDCDWEDYNVVGWESNARGKMGPRIVNLSSVMDEKKMAEQSVDLNLKLMRWRLLPDLDTEMLSKTKCLLLGAGTLGCGVARTLMAWGVRHITFVDNGRVSYSNPVRQSLFEISDCGGAGGSGGAFKAIAAAAALQRIFPGVNATGVVATIPMPGHAFGNATDEAAVEADSAKLDELIKANDVIFLLTDTRESRWLPTVIASSYDKVLINAALGLDR